VAPVKNTKSQLVVCGAPAITNFFRCLGSGETIFQPRMYQIARMIRRTMREASVGLRA